MKKIIATTITMVLLSTSAYAQEVKPIKPVVSSTGIPANLVGGLTTVTTLTTAAAFLAAAALVASSGSATSTTTTSASGT